MTDRHKVVYILVQDGDTESPGRRRPGGPPSRYTRSLLQSTLQFMGCKPRHAFKICDRVFDILKAELPVKPSKILMPPGISLDGEEVSKRSKEPTKIDGKELESLAPGIKKHASRKRSTVTITREKFLDVVCEALAQYQYVGPNQRADLTMACRVRERKSSVTILLCGTSGCGKSTLSSLLASRLGITTVVSTDSLRHMMRSFVDEKENPLLWASTYHAGECLDPVAVAEAKSKKRAAKMSSLPMHPSSDELGLNGAHLNGSVAARYNGGENLFPAEVLEPPLGSGDGKLKSVQADLSPDWADSLVGPKTMALAGYKAQSEMVIDSLDRLLTSWEQKGESVIVEGVHLSLNFVMALMAKHPSIIPFMVYISNEAKHLERFAVRAKYMTLDPARNKYVKYIRNIRTIQEYLCSRADKFLVPKVNNTNVDKSVAAIHATIFSSLRRREKGEPLFDRATMTVKVVNQEYQNQYAASALSSKYMFQLIQRKGSSRQLMALMNVDGSVAKAWPIVTSSAEGKLLSNGDSSEIGSPVYGPITGEIGTAEPVNLQFGSYGLSAWPNDAGGTSSHGSVDGQSSRGDPYDGSGHGSPYAVSPREHSSSPRDNSDKELIFDDLSVSDSEEEAEEEESKYNSDAEEAEEDEVEGSVDDQSIISDEDGDDFRLGDEGDEPDDEEWSYDAEEADTPIPDDSEQASFVDNNSGGPKVGNDRLRTHSTVLPRSHSGKSHRSLSGLTEEALNVHLSSSNLTDESTEAAKSHLTVSSPYLGTRLHPRARSSTVR